VYPEKAKKPRWRFLVRLFDTYKTMYAFARAAHMDKSRNNRAICYLYTDKGERHHIKECLGEILFCRRDMTVEVVSHESFHASLAWWRFLHSEPLEGTTVIQSASEERVVAAMGKIALQIENRLGDFRPKAPTDQ
jgi:hypothetical protein